MYSSVSDVPTIVASIRAGATDYVVKPALLTTIQEAIRRAIANRITCSVPIPAQGRELLDEIVGSSSAIRELKERLLHFAPTSCPILLVAESGTGKELAARTIHNLSKHSSGPFVAVNCAAIPETLFESEMFGVERGAFTDATTRKGYFERADGGTLFLDEIGELSQSAQSKLLRVLEDGKVCRVGTTRYLELRCRVVLATNADLKTEMAEGRFRKDLYYRINTLMVSIPPLRERKEDVPDLVLAFLGVVAIRRFSDSALRRLLEHDWPGNVRELRGVINRAAILAGEQTIESQHIQFL